MTNTVQVSTTGSQADITLIQIRGFLDTMVAYTLQEQVNALLEEGKCKYIVNLEELEHISSAGIGFFSDLVLKLRKRQGQLVFIHIPEPVQHLFKITRLMEIFTVEETMQDALSKLDAVELTINN